jgi:dUTPase
MEEQKYHFIVPPLDLRFLELSLTLHLRERNVANTGIHFYLPFNTGFHLTKKSEQGKKFSC